MITKMISLLPSVFKVQNVVTVNALGDQRGDTDKNDDPNIRF